MKNEFKELGTILKRGPRLKDDGSSLNSAVRKAMADHQRILKIGLARIKRLGGRYPNKLAGKRTIKLDDGTIITTWLNPFGLAPTLKAQVILPQVLSIEEEETIIALIIERGLAQIVPSPGEPDILRIYAGTDEVAYFAGAGDTWSWGYVAQAQGLFYESEDGESLEWSGPPVLDTSNSYPHTLWTIPGIEASTVEDALTGWANSTDRDPVTHTGLIRFLVQSMQANYNNILLAPPDWIPYDSRWYGLMRQRDTTIGVETLRYWLVTVSSRGVWAVALEPEEVVSDLIADLYAGNYSSEQKLSAEATVLAALRLPEGATGTKLLTDTQMDDAHGDGFGPLKHGWHFSPQMWGTASESSTDAVMLAVKSVDDGSGNFYWETKQCTLTFSFSGATASAVLSTENDGETGLYSEHNLWAWNDSVSKYVRQNFNSAAPARDGDIWMVYRPDGPHVEAYSYYYEAVAGGRNPHGALGVCGGGGASSEIPWSVSGVRHEGGFSSTSGNVDYISGFERVERMELSSGGGSSVGPRYFCSTGGAQLDGIDRSLLYTSLSGSPTECFEGGYVNDTEDPGASMYLAEVTLNTATIVFTKSDPSYQSGGFAGAALLITRDPTVFITANQWGKRLDADWTDYTWTGSGYVTDVSWSGENGSGSASLAWGTYFATTGVGAQGGFVKYQRDDCDETHTDWSARSSWYITVGSHTSSELILEEDEYHTTGGVTMHHNGGEIELVDWGPYMSQDGENWDAWRAFCTPVPLTPPISGPDAITGYGGHIIYREMIGNYITPDGYDASAVVDSIFARFVGVS